MKTILNKIWNFLMLVAETRQAAALARLGRYEQARKLMVGN
jgi:hypothetical protein